MLANLLLYDKGRPMNRFKRLFSILFMIGLMPAIYLYAADQEVPDRISKVATRACQFLKFEVSSKTAALGGANVAGVNDLSALHLNPAGLGKVDQNSFYGTYTNLYAGIQHGYVAFGMPIGRSDYLGISFTYLNSGDMPVTTVQSPDGTGEYFSVSNIAAGLTYARSLTDRLDVGLTVKYIHESIWHEKGGAVAFDIGSQFDTGIKGIKLGMAITNFGTSIKLDGEDLDIIIDTDEDYEGNANTDARLTTESWDLPLIFRMGVECDLMGPESELITNQNNRLTLSFDGNDPMDNFLRFNLGLEYEYGRILALRGGYHFNYDTAGFSCGVGLKLNIQGVPLQFDYALVEYGILGYVNQMSIQIKI